MHAVQMEYIHFQVCKYAWIHWLLLPFNTGSVKSREEGEEMVQATPDHETVYDTIDEHEMASLSCRAEPTRGGELYSTPQLSQSLL